MSFVFTEPSPHFRGSSRTSSAVTFSLARHSPKPTRGPRPTDRRAGARPRPEIAELLQQGLQHQSERDFVRAAACYSEALARQPNQPDALHFLGTLALAIGDIDTAIGHFKRALATKSSDPTIYINLANALLQKRDFTPAEIYLRRALELDPGNPAATCFLADTRSFEGKEREAKQLYEDVLTRFPDYQQATFGYADVLVSLGELETARTLYRKALGWSGARGLALAGLAACEKLAPDSPEAKEIERRLTERGLSALEYLGLRYAAGRIADDAGRPDDAFRHFNEAKKLSAAQFDIQAHRAQLSALKSLFTPAFFAARKDHGDRSEKPVFVVGMPRSGTTLTEQIISAHPLAAGAGELGKITRIDSSLGFDRPGEDYAKRVSALSPAKIRNLAKGYLLDLDAVSGSAARVVDKMPHNFLHLGLIALLFPAAKIIHCRRDPLDNCVSLVTTQMDQALHPYTADLATLGAYYREYVALMAHWQSVLPLPILESTYEALIDDVEGGARRLIGFVGLEWDPACLAFQQSDQPIHTASRVQVRQPLYQTSVGRWRRYEKHLEPLKAALGDLAAS
jgi:tetratricopeptide (TPR) repeat protein